MAQQLEEGQRCVVILADSVRNYMWETNKIKKKIKMNSGMSESKSTSV